MWRSLVVALAFAAVAPQAGLAQSTDTKAAWIEPPATSTAAPSQTTDPGQISTRTIRTDLGPAQIAPAPKVGAVDAAQLVTSGPSVDASPSLSTPSQGRNTRVGVVGGHDRCDPAEARPSDSTDCDQIIERRADAFAAPHRRTDPAMVDPDAPAPNIVNDIVNGGTGTIVSMPK